MIHSSYSMLWRCIKLIVIIIFTVIVFLNGKNHEPWRDEAHSWYTAREHSIIQIIDNAKYDRVPVNWTILLTPFAKIGLPYFTLTVISILLAIASVALFLFKSKISFFTKILFIFSYYITYEYSVIARNYGLVIFVLFLIAVVYRNRFKNIISYSILVAFLFGINDFTIVPASVLVLAFFIEVMIRNQVSKKSLSGLLIMILGGAFTIVTLIGLPTLYDEGHISWNHLTALKDTITHLVLPTLNSYSFPYFPSIFFSWIVLSLSSLIIILFIIFISQNKLILLMSLLSIGWQFYINIYIHAGSHRHHGLILIFIIFYWWVLKDNKVDTSRFYIITEKILNLALCLLLIISIFYSINIYLLERQYPFSGAKNMADYIKKNNIQSNDIVAFQGGISESVLPYLDTQFYFPEYKSKGSFELNNVRYIERLAKIDDDHSALDWVESVFDSNRPVFLLWNKPLGSNMEKWTLLHTSKAVYFWGNATEDLYLYSNYSGLKLVGK